MQENWQHIIYNQEVPPPAGTWDELALALDEEKLNPNWIHQLYQQEVAPPAGSWNIISEQLDKDVLAGTWAAVLYNKEDMPPAGVWELIAGKLQQGNATDWQTGIYNHEVLPPETAWQQITIALDSTRAKVVSIKNTRRVIRRLAVAAAILTAVSVLVLRIGSTDSADSASQPVVASTPVTDTKIPVAAADSVIQQSPVSINAASETYTARNTVKKTTRAAVTPKATATPIGELSFLPEEKTKTLPDVAAVLTNTKKLPDEKGLVATDITRMDAPAGTYVIIGGPDGQSVRLSAKMASLIGYLEDSDVIPERLDVIIKESALWKATFHDWREKMNGSLTAPSLLNLMDVIELNKLLKTAQ